MKKLYYLIGLVIVAMMVSCNNEEDNLFDQSSANRADASIKENMEIFTSAENGWLMKYFPAYQQEYGGYNMILSFGKDGKVKVANELYGQDVTVESYFSIKQSAGTIISFDTYNDLFHAFSDPSAPLGGQKGDGLEGDYDFSIMSASAEKIVLKGRKTGGYAVLTPMPADTEWSSYIEKIYEVENLMAANEYGLRIDDTEIGVMPSDRTFFFTSEEDGEEVSVMASYIVTPEGFEFYEPVTVLGYEISGFKVSDNGEFEETNNPNILLYAIPFTMTKNDFLGNFTFEFESYFGGTDGNDVIVKEDPEAENGIIISNLFLNGLDLYGYYDIDNNKIYIYDWQEIGAVKIGSDVYYAVFANAGADADIAITVKSNGTMETTDLFGIYLFIDEEYTTAAGWYDISQYALFTKAGAARATSRGYKSMPNDWTPKTAPFKRIKKS